MTYWNIDSLNDALRVLVDCFEDIKEINDYALWPIRDEIERTIISLKEHIDGKIIPKDVTRASQDILEESDA